MKVSIEPDDEPLRQGWPRLQTITVENDGSDPILLDSTVGGPRDGVQRWRSFVLGAIVYDALQDHYRQRTTLNTRSAVPIDRGLMPPGSSRTFDLPVQALAAGTHTTTLTTTGWCIPTQELEGRVYLQPPGPMRAVGTFLPISAVREAHPAAELFSMPAIVRAGGLEPIACETSLTVEVAPDADDPPEAALARIGGGVIVDRSRRLRGSWILADDRGDLHIMRGDDHVRLSAGTVDPAVWRALEGGLPFEPVLVRFLGEAANDLRQTIPSCVGPQEQQSLEPSALVDLFQAADAAGLCVGWGRHTAINHGLIVQER